MPLKFYMLFEALQIVGKSMKIWVFCLLLLQKKVHEADHKASRPEQVNFEHLN